jgi:hypothetical protein
MADLLCGRNPSATQPNVIETSSKNDQRYQAMISPLALLPPTPYLGKRASAVASPFTREDDASAPDVKIFCQDRARQALWTRGEDGQEACASGGFNHLTASRYDTVCMTDRLDLKRHHRSVSGLELRGGGEQCGHS